jgi:hypothetical protein
VVRAHTFSEHIIGHVICAAVAAVGGGSCACIRQDDAVVRDPYFDMPLLLLLL